VYKCYKFRKNVVEKLSTDLPTAVDSFFESTDVKARIATKLGTISVTQKLTNFYFSVHKQILMIIRDFKKIWQINDIFV